jgi:radical SAM superfamily enzyme YgiQ (UPF0313 family)
MSRRQQERCRIFFREKDPGDIYTMSSTVLHSSVKKVLLVRPDLLGTPYAISKFGVKHQPMGLFYMAAPLVRDGFDVKYCDEILLDDFETMLLDYDPDIVGISVASPLFLRCKELVKIAKKHKKIVGLGGPHITALPGDSLRLSGADFAVIGESELVLPKILQGEYLEDLDGVAFWKNDDVVINERTSFIEDIDAIPWPARDIADMDRYRHDTEMGFHIHPKERMMRIISSRGCGYKCTFCARHRVFGRDTRRRDPLNVVDEMDFLNKTYGSTYFTFMDDTFTEEIGHAIAISEEMLKRNRNYKWCAYARVDVKPDLLEIMTRAGCLMLEYGVETGSQHVLNDIKKGTTIKEIETGFQNAKNAGIKTKAFFMVGLPTEGKDEFVESLDLARKVNPHYLWLSIFLPLPGSEIYDSLQSDEKIDFLRESFFHTHSRELNMRHRMFMIKFYLRAAYIKQFLKSLTWSETLYFVNTAVTFIKLSIGAALKNLSPFKRARAGSTAK